MKEVLIVLAHDKPEAAQRAQQSLEATGTHIRQRYGRSVLIVEAAPDVIETLSAHHGVAGVYAGPVPEEFSQRLDETGQMGITAWNQRHSAAFQKAKQERKGEGLSWDHPDYEPEGRQEP